MQPTRLLGVLALVSVVACRADDRDAHDEAERQFAAARSGPDSVLDLGRIDAGEWTRVFAFGPYTTRDAMESRIGAPVSDAAAGRIEGSDDVNMLIFADERSVLAHAAVSRRYGDFCDDAMGVAHPRPQARFSLTQPTGPGLRPCFTRISSPTR